LEFLLAWPPNGMSGGWGRASASPHTARYFHGYIDCLYQDSNGDWHLIDYKTNDVAAADVARLARQYEMQMYVYALAAERALGRPPIELALQFLRPGVEHIFPWNDAARDRAYDLVNNAINAATDWSLQ